MESGAVVYAALLRGINVGGKNKIKMTDLKLMFEDIGCTQVETYIQSGNVIFESDLSTVDFKAAIEQEIEKKFGFTIDVIIRTGEELVQILKNCPFTEQEIKTAEELNQEGESMYAALLSEVPAVENLKKLEAYTGEADRYFILNKDLYLLFRHSKRNSKLAVNLHKLKVANTVRNWKTLQKLCDMVNARCKS
jgi:uncharacterized protein (DUF1697 family)